MWTRYVGKLSTAPPLLIATLLAVALKLLYVGFAAVMAPHLPVDPSVVALHAGAACDGCGVDSLIPQSGSALYRFSGVWQRFDTLWYIRIATVGYDTPVSTVFFPLYPALIRLLMPVLGGVQSALAVAFAGAVLLFWSLLRLVELDFGRPIALRTLAVVAVWPQSFILFAGYTDSLAIGLVLTTFFLARSGRMGTAIPVAFLAGLAKSIGLLAAIPVAIYAWKSRSWRGACAALAPGFGYAAFLLYLRNAGFPPMTEVYATYWHIFVSPPWQTLAGALGSLGHPDQMLMLNLGLLTLVAALMLAKPLPPPYWSFALATIILFLTKETTPPLTSMSRYLLTVFPAFVGLARVMSSPLMLVLPAMVNLALLSKFLQWLFVV